MNKEYIKDPLNYVGGKYKLLNQILPLFPDKYKLFVDVFGGSGVVSANQDCKYVIYNDKLRELAGLIKYFYDNDCDFLLEQIYDIIKKYNLSKTNKKGYLQLREDFNELTINHNKIKYDMFYCLITHAFNYQTGFNSKGGYNLPFGNNRSSFNKSIAERFPLYIEKLQSKQKN